MILNLLYHLILFFFPTCVEAFADRNGDAHTSYRGFIARVIMWGMGSIIVSSFASYSIDGGFHEAIFYHVLPRAAVMSFLYFCGSFQYLVNFTQRHLTEADWRKHLNKKSIPDRWGWYRNMDWRLRMAGHGMLIVIGWIYYFL